MARNLTEAEKVRALESVSRHNAFVVGSAGDEYRRADEARFLFTREHLLVPCLNRAGREATLNTIGRRRT